MNDEDIDRLSELRAELRRVEAHHAAREKALHDEINAICAIIRGAIDKAKETCDAR